MADWYLLPELPIRLTARGDWLHGDTPLHPRVAILFGRNLVPQADGRFEVVLGPSRGAVEVADAAYFVHRLELRLTDAPDEALAAVVLHLSDGAVEPLDPTTLSQAVDNVLYCRLRRHGIPVRCRFTAEQYHQLAWHMGCEPPPAHLLLAGQSWPIAAEAAIAGQQTSQPTDA